MSFPEEKVWDLINDGWMRMSFKQRFLWDAIKLPPEEWELQGYGKMWVAAVIGSSIIYYNHFEYGFNPSPWQRHGVIERYESMQYELEAAVQRIMAQIETGYDNGPWGTPPIPGEYVPKRS
jgi:hypothetical protein